MMRSPAHSSGMMSPGQNFNSTGPNTNNISPVEWEPCSNFLFPNITNNLNQTESIEDVEELLPDLITDDELESINFSEMGLNDGKFRNTGLQIHVPLRRKVLLLSAKKQQKQTNKQNCNGYFSSEEQIYPVIN